ncbi:MAG: hypothetical protein AAF416_05705 [Pseudomonadota bacterium]
MSRLATACLSLMLLSAPANASILFSFNETPTGVEGVLSGSLDTDALSVFNTASGLAPQIDPIDGFIATGGTVAGNSLEAFALAAGATFGLGGTTVASGSTGSDFAFNTLFFGTPVVFLPSSYISGSLLGGTIDFDGATYASLGVLPGAFVLGVLGSDETVTFEFNEAVPLPAGIITLLSGLGLLTIMRRRRAVAG